MSAEREKLLMRLRCVDFGTYESVCHEAANEIERLEAERDTALRALERIADPNDPLIGIGSESEFAQGVLDKIRDAGVPQP